jgi:predicted transposase/invertase (TIGR01784 family)
MQQQIPNPHDSLFKQVFSDKQQVISFLQNYLPDRIFNLLDLDALTISQGSFVDKNLSHHHSDILYRTTIKSTPCFIYFLFEHKRTCEQDIGLQLLRYMVKIWELYLKQKNPFPLPIIIPLVIYNGEYKWHVRNDFVSLFHLPDPDLKAFIPDFQFTVYDFSARSDEEIRGTVILQATLMAMKYITGPEPAKYLDRIFSLFKGLLESNTALEYIETLLTYIASTTDKITEEDIQKAIEQTDMEDVMPTLVQKWMEKGRMEGRLEGREEGMILEAQEMVMEALMERFGLLDPELSVKIRSVVNRDVLKGLLKLAIRVNSVQEFEERLKKLQL